MYIAHIRKDGTAQSVEEHLFSVATLCEQFGQKLGLPDLARLIGILHDLGKYTAEFNAYIHYSHLHPEDNSLRGKIPHSLQGALYLRKRFCSGSSLDFAAAVAALCISSHHSGLMDCISPIGTEPFYEQLARDDSKLHFEEAQENFHRECSSSDKLDGLFASAKAELNALLQRLKKQGLLSNYSMHLVVRFLFSCLIDADRYDAFCFAADQLPTNQPHPLWEMCLKRLNAYLGEKTPLLLSEEANQVLYAGGSAALTPGENIALLRAAISRRCADAGQNPSGIYRLTVPTGGGKTLSSLRFALAHALAHGKERILYIIPFTTIIDQNAAVIRDALGSDVGILEHHASILPEQQPIDEDYELLTERWNSPIILTTMVQFLNTLFAAGTRSARRMHSLSNAVIIFDEIQSVPIKCINLLNTALNFLCGVCNSTVVLCTATQPLLSFVERPLLFSAHPELIPDPRILFPAFQRTRIVDKRIPGGYSPQQLADFLLQSMEGLSTGLAVLNTKKDARALYREICRRNECQSEEMRYRVFLLSTDFCPAHRRLILDEIFAQMKSGRVLVVSTQLIEAGVDISFQLAIRALAGLDAIAQTAGRCNRNAEAALRDVYIVNIANENLKYLPEIQLAQDATNNVLDCGMFDSDSLLAPEALERYYAAYYSYNKGNMDYPLEPAPGLPALTTLYDLLGDNRVGRAALCGQIKKPPLVQAFATAGRQFEAIEHNTRALLVPFERGKQLIETLQNGNLSLKECREVLREAQQYSVNVYDYVTIRLEKEGAIRKLQNEILALDKQFYSLKYGVITQGEKMELLDYRK